MGRPKWTLPLVHGLALSLLEERAPIETLASASTLPDEADPQITGCEAEVVLWAAEEH